MDKMSKFHLKKKLDWALINCWKIKKVEAGSYCKAVLYSRVIGNENWSAMLQF